MQENQITDGERENGSTKLDTHNADWGDLRISIPYLIRFLQFVVRRLRKEIVEGKWYVYHTTNRSNEFQVEPSVWDIRKGFDSKFVVEETKEGLKNPMYKGVLLLERNFWVVRLQGVKHEEEVSIRLLNPIPTADLVSWGLYLGLDFQGNPISGPTLISRQQLSQEDALKLLLEKTRVVEQARLLMM